MTNQPELIPVRPIERELSLQFKIAYDLGAKVQRLEAEQRTLLERFRKLADEMEGALKRVDLDRRRFAFAPIQASKSIEATIQIAQSHVRNALATCETFERKEQA